MFPSIQMIIFQLEKRKKCIRSCKTFAVCINWTVQFCTVILHSYLRCLDLLNGISIFVMTPNYPFHFFEKYWGETLQLLLALNGTDCFSLHLLHLACLCWATVHVGISPSITKPHAVVLGEIFRKSLLSLFLYVFIMEVKDPLIYITS